MNIKDSYLDSLKARGYTEIEARFIYIVATHSGYFTAKQFLDFADARRGKRSDKFADKLVRNRHASAEMLRKNARVYHIFSRKIYAPIGKENIRNRRDHEFEFIKTRLFALDYPKRTGRSPSTHARFRHTSIFIPALPLRGEHRNTSSVHPLRYTFGSPQRSRQPLRDERHTSGET